MNWYTKYNATFPLGSDNCMGEYIAVLQKQNDFLTNEGIFLRKDLSEKLKLLKSLLQKESVNKDNQESSSYNNFTKK